MKTQKNNNGVFVGILAGLIIALGIGICLFLTGIISFKTNEQLLPEESNFSEASEADVDNKIQAKLVDNLNCSDSETTFNGITVKIEQKINDMVCVASSVMINDNDIIKDVSSGVDSYEFYDDNIIIMSHSTSGSLFTIHNVTSGLAKIKFSSGDSSLEGYLVDSYSTNDNTITINARGCGAQCGEKGIENGGYKATFEIEYSNKEFSQPKLINREKENE